MKQCHLQKERERERNITPKFPKSRDSWRRCYAKFDLHGKNAKDKHTSLFRENVL